MVKDKNNMNWCTKHQVVHRNRVYKSCRYPNDKGVSKCL